jgi:hypothetical protein
LGYVTPVAFEKQNARGKGRMSHQFKRPFFVEQTSFSRAINRGYPLTGSMKIPDVCLLSRAV